MEEKLGGMKLMTKKAWTPMKVSVVGKATDLIKTGGGKLSLAGGDPGEGKKQKAG